MDCLLPGLAKCPGGRVPNALRNEQGTQQKSLDLRLIPRHHYFRRQVFIGSLLSLLSASALKRITQSVIKSEQYSPLAHARHGRASWKLDGEREKKSTRLLWLFASSLLLRFCCFFLCLVYSQCHLSLGPRDGSRWSYWHPVYPSVIRREISVELLGLCLCSEHSLGYRNSSKTGARPQLLPPPVVAQ